MEQDLIRKRFAPSRPEFDKKFMLVAYGMLILVIIFFTYLHHYQPQVLRVPNNADVSLWKSPTFEQTCIYDRMTEAEKQKVLTEGIPVREPAVLVFMEIFSIAIASICFIHAYKYFGPWMASCFLVGSFIFTGMQESIWILYGRFFGASAMQGLGEQVWGTYWFPKGGLWFIETPVLVCLGWFYIAYSCVLIAGKIFPKMRLLGRAAIGGLTAVFLDLWVDPVATSPESMQWVWAKGDFIRLFGIPHTNFLGWFFLIFMFAIFWEWLPVMEKKWGRLKASLIFFVILFVAEISILILIMAWSAIFRNIFILIGIDHTLFIPPGW
jgi:hypothetical protein